MKKTLSTITLILLLAIAILFNYRPRPEQLARYLVEGKPAKTENNELTVQFLGNTNLLFSDGNTAILTDGFFSRPSVLKVLFGKVEPDRTAIINCLNRAGFSKLDAVIPLHSHFDHAMDAPAVAQITRAKLMGSSSTANIGRGYGLAERQIEIPQLDSTYSIGDFKVTFIKSQHWQYPDAEQRLVLLNNAIEKPLITPASIYDYKEGDSYTLLIEHGSIKIAVQGSAGYKPGSLNHFDADILFLAIAGLEMMDEQYNDGYQQHLIEPLQPEVLIPIHWDDFTVPLGDELKTTNLLVKLKMDTNLEGAFQQIEKRNLSQGRAIKVLPLWQRVGIKQLIDNK